MAEERIRLDRRYDWVGPPDMASKIRGIKLRRLNNETPLEAQYREEREKLNRWCSDFWTEHNRLFDQKKVEFVEKKKKELGRVEHVSANDMSTFYKDFLNDRHSALTQFNKEWYRRNLSLIWPALKVNLVRMRRLVLRR